VAAPNSIWTINPQPSYALLCPAADIYRNGILQLEAGVNYNLSPSGLVATFNAVSQPQAGDNVKVTYRCSLP
jgi:hypothetical protein